MSTSEAAAPSRRRWLLPTVIVAVLIAIPVTSFLTFRADPKPVPSTVSARSMAERTGQLEERVAADPDDLEAWQALAVAYTGRASASGDPAFYDLAERALAKADDLEPDAPGTLVARGHLLLSLHEFSEAEEVGQQAAAALPSNAGALGVLVDAQVELGDYEAATATLQRMVDRDPGLPALSRVSYLRELNGDLAGATTALQQAEIAGASLGLERADVATLLGHLHRQRGQLDAADAAYARALELVPTSIPARLGQLRIVASRDGAAAALPAVQELVTAVPRLDAILLQTELATAAGEAELAASSLELARAAAALQAAAGQVVDLELALLEADLGDATEAVALAQRAFDARPDNVFAADALAWALHRAGRNDEALPFLATSLRLGTVSPQVRFHAAAILAEADRTDEAAEHLTVVTDGDPWFSFALLDEGTALAGELGVDAPPAWSPR